MAIFCTPDEESSLPQCPATRVTIGHVGYANTAAKFWATLLHEVYWIFPEYDRLELRATCVGLLSPALLDPAAALGREIERLRAQDVRSVLYDTIAQLAIDGPPPPVLARILADGRPTVGRSIPLDCLDAELFPYLLAWLLRWAGITHHLWDAEALRGGFTAAALGSQRAYTIRFEAHCRHLSEGLYERTVALHYAVRSTA